MIKVGGVPVAAVPSVTGKQKKIKFWCFAKKDSEYVLKTFVKFRK